MQMKKYGAALLIAVLVSLPFAGCEEEEEGPNVRETLARGESKLVTLETKAGGYNDTLETVYAELKQADVNHFDIIFVTVGIKDREHARAQLQVTAHADAPVGTYTMVVTFYVTYYDDSWGETRSTSRDMTIEINVT